MMLNGDACSNLYVGGGGGGGAPGYHGLTLVSWVAGRHHGHHSSVFPGTIHNISIVVTNIVPCTTSFFAFFDLSESTSLSRPRLLERNVLVAVIPSFWRSTNWG